MWANTSALILLAAVGMMFLVSSEDILMIFISLELTSLSLYILTAFNKRNPKSAEAALKYFLFGGMSAAVHAVWVEPALRAIGLHQPGPDRRGHHRPEA